MFKSIKISALIATTLLTVACTSTSTDNQSPEKALTVGLVQKEISTGVSAVHVAQTLGSPNIVKKSPNTNGEVWIYDKISQTKSDTSLGINILGMGSDVAGLIGGNAATSETSSKTLTVIIKFDESDMVKDVSYFRSSF